MVTEIQMFETTYTEALFMVISKEKLLSVNLILILCLNDRFVTVNNKFRKSYRQPQ
jgi:hypothetical protein